jgi:rhodanese-related sulfurtransferase
MIRNVALSCTTLLVATLAFAGEPAVSLVSQEALLERQNKADPALFVLDVRTPEEFSAGHVPGAVNIPHDKIAARLMDVPKDKDVVVYCRSGRRSDLAAAALAANGYTRLGHLEGDMLAWEAKGQPVERPAAAKASGQ